MIINCPGYGGRKLWADESIVPVRGQIAWLIPQAGVHYGLIYKALNVVARRDGIVVQPIPGGDDFGWNDANEEPDRQAAEAGSCCSRSSSIEWRRCAADGPCRLPPSTG